MTKPKKPVPKKPKSKPKKSKVAKVTKDKGLEKLTPMEELAVHAFMSNGGNQSQALLAVNKAARKWTKPTLWSKASHLFAQTKVQARLKALLLESAERAVIHDAELLMEMANLTLANITRLHDWDGQLLPMAEWPRRESAAVQSITYENVPVLGPDGKPTGEVVSRIKKLNMAPKGGAAEKLFKHLGLYERDNQQKASFERNWLENMPDDRRSLMVQKLLEISGRTDSDTTTQPGLDGRAEPV